MGASILYKDYLLLLLLLLLLLTELFLLMIYEINQNCFYINTLPAVCLFKKVIFLFVSLRIWTENFVN